MSVVWIISERCWGQKIKTIPHYVLIQYQKDGLDIEEWIENDDIIDYSEMGIDYELEEDL